MDNSLVQVEIHKSLYAYTITIDLDRVGIDEIKSDKGSEMKIKTIEITPKEKAKRTSKFSSKYSDRIASIREADEMIKLKEQKMKKEAKKAKKTTKQKKEMFKEDEEILLLQRKLSKRMQLKRSSRIEKG